MLKKVNLVTTAYPYLVGEQFLENEINYWGNDDLLLIPLKYGSEKRDVGSKECDPSIAQELGLEPSVFKFKYLFQALFSMDFIRSIKDDFTILTSPKKIINLLRFIYLGILFAELLEKKYGPEIKADTVFYTYWFSFASYGLTRLKKKGYSFHLITRAHRTDLYRYAQVGNYMPMNKSYARYIDEIHSISKDGKDYLAEKYSIDPNKIYISKLGVSDREGEQFGTNEEGNVIHFLSISYVKPVKRVLLIADKIEQFQNANKDKLVKWTHIGAGEEFDSLLNRTKKMKAEVTLLGQLSNPELLTYLKENKFDLFLNCSVSEGIPVTIMEAMSYGIPIVATDVGGTKEAVSPSVGALLNVDFNDEEFNSAVAYATKLSKLKVYQSYKANFSAEVNFKQFIKGVIERSTKKGTVRKNQ